jgi:hypothetical protein
LDRTGQHHEDGAMEVARREAFQEAENGWVVIAN